MVDDFVFMCMIVGNDFLSHLPHMSIENGALSTMLTTYEKLLPKVSEGCERSESATFIYSCD